MIAHDFHAVPSLPISWPVAVQTSGSFEHFPPFATTGTGGVITARSIYCRKHGYPVIGSEHSPALTNPVMPSPMHLMQQVQEGFGRTFSHLPAVFGVSRQTLYNWLKGETPKAAHLTKLQQLATAAQEFSRQGVKPSAQALHRRLSQNLSFIELLAQGAEGKAMADKLIRLETRGLDARQKLDELLKGQTTRTESSDLIRSSFNEDA